MTLHIPRCLRLLGVSCLTLGLGIDGSGSAFASAVPSATPDTAALEADFNAITRGVDEAPLDVVLPEATAGTLELGLNPDLFPVLVSDHGALAAASRLGKGRVVAFSAQDYMSSHGRSTLLRVDGIDALVRNAVGWASGRDDATGAAIKTDSDAMTSLLREGGYTNASTTSILPPRGLWSIRAWGAEALEGVDVVVAQVNEWGTLHIDPEHVATLRNFVEEGGGLVIGGSALHWSWWLSDTAADFHGNLILEGTGIRFNAVDQRDLTSARALFDSLAPPDALWRAYLAGKDLEASQLSRLPGLFQAAKDQGRDAEVNTGLTRLIADTPALPVSRQDPNARLSAEVAARLSPHVWPAPHPWTSTFPGVSTGVPVSTTTVVDTAWTRNQPLGVYAPPGGVVTVRVPAKHVKSGLRVEVGEHYDDLRNLGHIDEWRRAPALLRAFSVTTEKLAVGSPYGGAIYLVVPAGMKGRIKVEVEDAIPMVVHTTGESSADDWAASMAGNGAPQVILQEHGHVRLVVSASSAADVTNPDEVVDFWTGFHQHHVELAQEPTPRPYESHWIFDVQVGWGYANSTAQRITFPALSEGWALRSKTGNEDWWLFGHELGHQFQNADWSGGDVTEVCVNLFTMYTLNDYIFGGHGFETQGFNPNTIDHAALESYRWATADLFGKLQLYRQLVFEFGWDVYKDVFASYYSEDYSRESYGSFMDGFAIRFSALSKRDLTRFFEHWEYPVSAEAAATIRSFGNDVWMPEGW